MLEQGTVCRFYYFVPVPLEYLDQQQPNIGGVVDY
jgi:hypothetical protein